MATIEERLQVIEREHQALEREYAELKKTIELQTITTGLNSYCSCSCKSKRLFPCLQVCN